MRTTLLTLFLLIFLSPTAKSQGIAYMEAQYQQHLKTDTANTTLPKIRYRRGETWLVLGGVLFGLGTALLVSDIIKQDPELGIRLAGPALIIEGSIIFGIASAIYFTDKNDGRPRRPKPVTLAADKSGVGLAYNFK